MQFLSSTTPKGWTEMKLFDKDGKQKKLFQQNKLWDIAHKITGKDYRGRLFGKWTYDAIKVNTVTAVGKKACADQIGGTTATAMTALAIGTGTPSATALGAEISTLGGARAAATVSNQTTSTTGDTEQWLHTWTFTGSFAITEEGIFNNNVSGGIMLASQSFAAVNVVSGDNLQVTHKVQFT